MGTLSLKFLSENINPSLQVNDYVYYVDTSTNNGLEVNNGEAKLIGAVKSIKAPVKNVTLPMDIELDHYRSVDLSSYIDIDGPYGASKIYLGLTGLTITNATDSIAVPGVGTIKKQDIVTHANIPTGTVVTGFTNETVIGVDYAFAVISQSATSDVGAVGSNVNINFKSPEYKKINTPYTQDLLVGMYVSGGALSSSPINTTITNIEENKITISNIAASSDGTVNLTFSDEADLSAVSKTEVLINTNSVIPSNNAYYFFVKDTSVNTSGLLGYYADVKLVNNSTKSAELFSIGSEVVVSSK